MDEGIFLIQAVQPLLPTLQLCHQSVCPVLHSAQPKTIVFPYVTGMHALLLADVFFSPLIQCSCSQFYSPEAKEVMSQLARQYKNRRRNPMQVKTSIISVLSPAQNSLQELCRTTAEVEPVSLI